MSEDKMRTTPHLRVSPPSALLGLEPPLVRRENAKLLPVFGYRASRDGEALPAQDLGDLLVRQRLARVFGGHEVPDVLLDGDRGDHLPGVRGDAAVEEVLELEQPLGRLHVLVGGDAADGGLVHADVLADVPERQRAQVGHAPVEDRKSTRLNSSHSSISYAVFGWEKQSEGLA